MRRHAVIVDVVGRYDCRFEKMKWMRLKGGWDEFKKILNELFFLIYF
jgi:hypothetical protein